MPQFKRRHFLQLAGSTLASIGLSQTDFLRQSERYGKALAQDTSRKLALLVGINQYPEGIRSLKGCVTDVRMQYELLVHRFGFNPADILILSDEPQNLPVDSVIKAPTRANILEAFEQHLIAQAKEDDIVVFHYSGHGSQVIDPKPIPEFAPYNGTLMPTDARSAENLGREVDDIMGKTIFLLTHLLKTEQVTTVLDSCFAGGGIRGNLVYRSVDSRYDGGEAHPSETEKAYQAYLMEKAGLDEDTLLELRTAGIAKGFAIGSAQQNQLAADASFGEGQNKFNAGAFTYTLTRYLWQQPVSQPLESVFVKLARSTHDIANETKQPQEPIYDTANNCQTCENQFAYFLSTPTPSAEAVVTAVSSDIEFWMGGISSRSLKSFDAGAVFNLVNADGKVIGEVEQINRQGLVGKGKLVGDASLVVTPGMFLRERIRGVPANPTLKVGLHDSLGADIATAQAALEQIDRLEIVPVDQNSEIDFLFGRMNEEVRQQASFTSDRALPSQGRLCLFTESLLPISSSWNEERPNESITEAIGRLEARFKMLLAGRILKYVLNTDTSNVRLDAKVTPIGGRGGPTSGFGSRGAEEASGLDIQELSVDTRTLNAGTEIQLELKNDEGRDLYIAVLIVDSEGNLVILHPLTADAAEAQALVPKGETLIVPEPKENPQPDDFQFIIEGPAGFFEMLVIASTEPLRDALKALEQIAGVRGDSGRNPYVLDGDEAVNVIGSLLGDFDRSSRAGVSARTYSGSQLGVDTTKLAAISAIFQVVE